MKDNLLALYTQIPEDIREAGQAWYHDVRVWATMQADQFGVTTGQVAGVISATSPRMSWSKNLSIARQVMAIWAGGGDLQDILALPALKRSLTNAWCILQGDQGVLKGPKTHAFCDNISQVDSPEITIDVWAVRAARGDYQYPYTDVTKQYDEYASAYRAGASVAGMRGYEFQAACWIWVRHLSTSRVGLTQLTLL